MATHSGYVSPLEVISDVTSLVDDEGFKEFSEGSYMSEIQQALTELAFDTYFDHKAVVIELLGRTVVPIPEGMFAEDALYAFSGSHCDRSPANTVFYARNYIRYGNRLFKQQKGENNDPFTDNVASLSSVGSILFYNKLDYEFHFSDAVAGFEKILIEYRGMGCKLGDAPIIPNELRQAVKDYVALQMATKLYGRYRTNDRLNVLRILEERLRGGRGFNNVGSWMQAKRRVQSISSNEREHMRRYLSNLSRPKV